MSIDFTNLNSYDQGIYDSLKAEYASTPGKTEADLQKRLNELTAPGILDFQQASQLVHDELPSLSTPLKTSAATSGLASTFGAQVLALITENANEQRKQARETRIAEQEELISSINEQAQDIRDKAKAQLITGCVTGVVTIGASVACAVAQYKMTTNARTELEATMEDAASDAFKAALGGKEGQIAQYVAGIRSGMDGAVGIGKSIGEEQATLYDAQLKNDEATTEKIRQSVEVIKDLEESLSALIQKSQATQDAIASTINETNRRILA